MGEQMDILESRMETDGKINGRGNTASRVKALADTSLTLCPYFQHGQLDKAVEKMNQKE